MLRRHARAYTQGLLLLAAICGCHPSESPIDRVILITIDTLRQDHLGYTGYPRNTSPFIDRLAAEGVVFATAISGSSHTGPSHATIFSGIYPLQHGVMHNYDGFAPAVPTLAVMLRQAGFKTAAFASVSFLEGITRGFDVVSTNDTKRAAQRASITLQKALQWTEALQTGDRYFLWVHFFDPHMWKSKRWIRPKEIAAARADSSLDEAEILAFLEREHGLVAGWNREEGGPMAAVDRYDAQIVKVDSQIERLFESLEERGLLEHSVIILTADHGEGLGSHNMSGHGIYVYEEQVHVPLVLRFDDGRYAGRVVQEVVRHVDLLPTIAELTGAEVDLSYLPLQGRTLLELLGKDVEPEPRLAFSQRRPADELRTAAGWEKGDIQSVRDATFKYIYHSEGDDELYDLVRDPLESENIADRSPAVLARMREARQQLYEHMMSRGAGAAAIINHDNIEELRALGYMQ